MIATLVVKTVKKNRQIPYSLYFLHKQQQTVLLMIFGRLGEYCIVESNCKNFLFSFIIRSTNASKLFYFIQYE